MVTIIEEGENQFNRKENRRKTPLAAKIILFVFAVFIFLGIFGNLIWGLIGVNMHYSDGERSVKIIKLSEKGLFWKTWEAEGVLSQGGVGVTYVWDFSIDNQDPNKTQLVNELKNAFDTGNTVIIKYDQRAGSVPWRSETPYFVKEVVSHINN